MNLPKRWSFKVVLKVYTLSKILLWIKPSYFSLENASYSWCLHQSGLFSSASVVPQNKFTGELWSSASVLLSCVARRPLFLKVNLPRCEAQRHHFIMTCDIFGTGHRNILALCYLFGKTWPAHSSATQATEINTLDQITGKVIDVSRTHIPLKALMIPLKRVKLRGVV